MVPDHIILGDVGGVIQVSHHQFLKNRVLASHPAKNSTTTAAASSSAFSRRRKPSQLERTTAHSAEDHRDSHHRGQHNQYNPPDAQGSTAVLLRHYRCMFVVEVVELLLLLPRRRDWGASFREHEAHRPFVAPPHGPKQVVLRAALKSTRVWMHQKVKVATVGHHPRDDLVVAVDR